MSATDEVTPQPPVDRVARSFPALALFAGITAALVIPGHAPGLNWFLVAVLVTGAAFFHARADLGHEDIVFVAAGLGLMTFFLLRSAAWLLALNVVAAIGLAAVGFGRRRTWFEIGWVPAHLLARFPRGLALTGGPVRGWVRSTSGDGRRSVVRAGALATALVVVFAGLFMSADRAFASLAQRFLLPDLQVPTLLPPRVLMGLVTVAGTGALVLLRTRHEAHRVRWVRLFSPARRFTLGPTEWVTALVALNGLFALFVSLQLAVLFGGHTRVLETTGLTYAEYARGGFFQLVSVAFLTLAVVAAAVRFGRADDGQRLLMKALLGVLCALTLVVLASAMRRMNLYEEAYGFTRLRLLVDTTILWLAGVFVLLLVAGWMWRGTWLPRAATGLAAIALVGLNLADPDALVAERNLRRLEATGSVDLHYLQTLSADAVPALAGLHEPERSCVLEAISESTPKDETAWAFNLSRQRATDVLDSLGRRGAPACSGALGL
jgi:hypothetical protein